MNSAQVSIKHRQAMVHNIYKKSVYINNIIKLISAEDIFLHAEYNIFNASFFLKCTT